MDSTIGFLLKKIHTTIEKNANNNLRKIGLTFSQVHILSYIADHRQASFKEIESYFSLSQPTVVGLLKRLSDKGFVAITTDPADKRAKLVGLTESGQKVCDNGKLRQRESAAKMTRFLDEAEQKTLQALLEKVYQGLNA